MGVTWQSDELFELLLENIVPLGSQFRGDRRHRSSRCCTDVRQQWEVVFLVQRHKASTAKVLLEGCWEVAAERKITEGGEVCQDVRVNGGCRTCIHGSEMIDTESRGTGGESLWRLTQYLSDG